MGSKPTERELQAEANRLYWGSDLSVNQIAEALNLSKSALYGLLQPAEADTDCPACGARMVFDNRTARERGLARCPACDGVSGSGDGPTPEGTDAADLHERLEEPVRAAGDEVDALPSVGRTLAAGALLGAAVGLAVVLWAERRR